MSINGSGSTFIPFTLSGLTSITASNSNIGVATATSLMMTTATPNKIARFNGSQELVSSTVDVSDIAVLGANNTFGTGYTNNLNGAIKTVNNPLAINNAGINAETISAIVPSTYTFVSGFWRFVSPSSLTGSMQFPNAFTYGTTPFQKYILTLTGCSTNGTDPVTATVYNATTSLTISDATQTITSTAGTITFTFMTGVSPSIIYLNFSAGAINYFVQWSALSVQQCNTEVLGNLVLDAPIISNITQSPGTTTNVAGGLLVSQTSTGVSATTFTQTGMPSSAPVSTLTFASPIYTLTATGSFATWLGTGTTYITGAKYTFNFGTMFGSQALQLQVVQYNALGSAYVDIGDVPYSVSKTSSTISGSFTAGLNASYLGSIVFFFTPTSFSQNVKFNTFTMTRADTSITGVTSLSTNTGTVVSGLGLNASNQIITTSVPVDFSAVSIGSVPYESASNVFSNSLITQGTYDFGYTGASFTASTGIASITFSSPTYTANSNASFQGIITLPALPSSALTFPCTATFTATTFPFFAVAPYPYFTLTNGATIVYTSPVGSPGTVTIPFTPTSTTLFVTLYFKTPPTPQTAGIFTWTNFTITTPSMTTTGFSNTTGIQTVGELVSAGSITKKTATAGSLVQISGGGATTSPYLEFLFGGTARGYIGDTTATDMYIASQNGAKLNFITASASRMTISTTGDVNVASNLTATTNLTGGSVIVNGGGSYVAGCLYSDANWGILFRARVPGVAAAFAWFNSVGTELMRLTDGRIFTAGQASAPVIIGNTAEGTIRWANPNGTVSHWGYPSGGGSDNYIRGTLTIVDTPMTLNSSPSGGFPRIQSANNDRAVMFDDGSGLTYLLNQSGATPISFGPGSWSTGGGGYTLVSRATGNSTSALAFGTSAGRGVIISLTAGIVWNDLILSGGNVYISNFGTISLLANGGNWVFVSDRRTKRDIKPIKTKRSLERIMALKPMTYKKIYRPELSDTPIPQEVIDKDHIGLIAQDVMEVNPHCVSEIMDDKCVDGDDDGKRFGVAYGDLHIHSIGAIQELKKQNDAQQKEIDELKEMVKALMAKLA